MEIFLFYIMLVVLVSLFLVIVCAMRGPTVYDRMLAANAFGSKTMILIMLVALIIDAAMLIDIALVYAMINFTVTLGFLAYTRNKKVGKA